MAQGVPRSAVGYLDRALREPPSASQRADVLAALGRAQAVAGRPEAVGHLEAAVALAAEPRQRAALLLDLGRALHHAGRLDDGRARRSSAGSTSWVRTAARLRPTSRAPT